MRATVALKATFDYDDELGYAETLTELMDRARELCVVEMVGLARGEGQATDGPVPGKCSATWRKMGRTCCSPPNQCRDWIG
jgi:hypothetical protein